VRGDGFCGYSGLPEFRLVHGFLRHIERTSAAALIDATSTDPIADYHTIQEELQAYGRVAERPQILATRLMQLIWRRKFGNGTLRNSEQRPGFLISAVTHTGLDPLLQQIWLLLLTNSPLRALRSQPVWCMESGLDQL